MQEKNIPAMLDAIQDNVRMGLAGGDIFVVCPNTGEEIQTRVDEGGTGVVRDEDGKPAFRFRVRVERVND